MGFGKKPLEDVNAAVAEHQGDPTLAAVAEEARQARLARRKVFVARLPLPETATGSGDVQSWSAAVHQIQMHGFSLDQWSVVSEPGGVVAYAVFGTD